MRDIFQKPSDFFEKYVIVMGLGLHGGGIAVTEWLYAQGAHVCVTDLRDENDLLPSVRAVQNFCKDFLLEHPEKKVFSVEWVLGEHRSEEMARADLIVQNPGVPFDSPYLFLARSAGVPVENEATLFLLLTQKTPKICVTGTRGKSTTTALIYEMLRTTYTHALCGGIAGAGIENFFSLIDRVLEHEAQDIFDPVVMEVSSYQLELFSRQTVAPHISVVTNIFSDHLNRHKTLDIYTETKENIVRFQSADDHAIFNYDGVQTRAMGRRYDGGIRWWFSRIQTFDGPGLFLLPDVSGDPSRRMICIREKNGSVQEVCFVGESPLKGEHAIENILAASCVARCAGVSVEGIVIAIKAFHGLPSRQEKIANIFGRIWINDTTATSPDATIAALRVFGDPDTMRIILITGGSDKDLDFTELALSIMRYVKSIVFLSGTATPRIIDAIHRAGFSGASTYVNSMHDAVISAWNSSCAGDTILLSSGCASFGMFIHEFDRGEQFVFEVNALRRSF